ncbi:hypothetical protein DS745_07350 [Anaerobacillus alkaliphilus]|uniref:Uncharacterized protein n=1 Tax=Anaerobacillus alkaliphilus TaxID=1548597 RepID=A0A4V1LGL7_9BACI|nr:hypothetical protein [Anaerobacillus alkaliphilus]RXJ02199.1 hypothetical protein DS745_07350 [Anaerobacillus alkaliphilus]
MKRFLIILIGILLTGCGTGQTISVQKSNTERLHNLIETTILSDDNIEFEREKVIPIIEDLLEENINAESFSYSRHVFTDIEEIEDDFDWGIDLISTSGTSLVYQSGDPAFVEFYGNGTTFYWKDNSKWYKTFDYYWTDFYLTNAQVKNMNVKFLHQLMEGNQFYGENQDLVVYYYTQIDNQIKKLRWITSLLEYNVEQIEGKISYENSNVYLVLLLDKGSQQFGLLSICEIYIDEGENNYRIREIYDYIEVNSLNEHNLMEIPIEVINKAIEKDIRGN